MVTFNRRHALALGGFATVALAACGGNGGLGGSSDSGGGDGGEKFSIGFALKVQDAP